MSAPEFAPPQASIGRIIKNALPENVQITKDARSAFTRAAGSITTLISFVTFLLYSNHLFLFDLLRNFYILFDIMCERVHQGK